MVEREGMRLRVAHAPVAPGPIAVALRPEKIRIVACGARWRFRKRRRRDRRPTSAISARSRIYKVRLDDGLVLKAAVMNEQRDAARTIHVNDRVWLSWAPEAGVLLTE